MLPGTCRTCRPDTHLQTGYPAGCPCCHADPLCPHTPHMCSASLPELRRSPERHRSRSSRSRSPARRHGSDGRADPRADRSRDRQGLDGERGSSRDGRDRRGGSEGAANGSAGAAMDAEGGEDGEEGGGGLKLDAELTAEELRMMQAMGIPFTFDTTQGRHVEDDSVNASGIKIKSKRTARQYMNRRGGFNRPLPAERTNERVARD